MRTHDDVAASRNPASVLGAEAVGRLGSILSIWAHPDDETYLAGGVMAAARGLGQRVVCVAATAGERGTAQPELWTPERLGRIRRWEASAAMAVLGVHEHRIHGLPDGDLAGCTVRGRAWVEQLLDEVRPDTILTFGPEGATFHPDHIAVHHWVSEAWERRGRRCRLLYATATRDHVARFGEMYARLGIYMTDDRPAGVGTDELALHLRLAGVQLDRKLTALRAMATQTNDLLAAVGLPEFLAEIAEESFVDAADARSSRTASPLAVTQ